MSATARTTVYTGYPFEDAMAQIMVENILFECGVKSYTLYKAKGMYAGHNEEAIIIEVLGDEGADDFAINEAAHVLKYNMDRPQEAVYIVRELVDLVIV